MATPPSPSANCIKDFYNKICRHFRFISVKRKLYIQNSRHHVFMLCAYSNITSQLRFSEIGHAKLRLCNRGLGLPCQPFHHTSAFASSPLSHVPNACTLLESRILLSPQDSLFGLLARTLQKDPNLSNIPLFDVEKALREIVQKTSDCLR